MKERIVAAIPNYNMGEHAAALGKLLLCQDYDHVYVLDDCSTDDSLAQLQKVQDKRFTVVEGEINVGAGAVRNRILDYEHHGYVHFLDADVVPLSKAMPEAVVAAFGRHPDAGVLGFRVKNPDGSQYQHNYGPLITNPSFLASVPYSKASRRWPSVFRPRKREPWNIIPEEDAVQEHIVEAVVECNMAVRLEDFEMAGGFAEDLRFHEIHHLALNLRKFKKTIWYVPENSVVKYDHKDVRPARRKEELQAMKKIFKNKVTGKYR